MSANHKTGRGPANNSSSLRSLSRKGVHAAKKTIVTLGDLVTAACDVTGSADAAALLLSPVSPLARRLGRRIVIA